jgi:hypothetical protein
MNGNRRITALLAGLTLLAFTSSTFLPTPAGASEVRVTVDGRPLALNPAPLIQDGRTLVPLRQIFEALKAEVVWDGPSQTVTARRTGSYVRFRIGDRFACLDEACDRAALMDVPSRLLGDRTFVPLRFVATALGARVDWDAATRTVAILDLPWWSLEPRGPRLEVIAPRTMSGTVTLQARASGIEADSIRFYLLDRETARGPVIALGREVQAAYLWRPDPGLNGRRYLAAVAYDQAGRPVAYSELLPVQVSAGGSPALTGVATGQTVTGPVSLGVAHDFVAAYARYVLVDPSTGAETLLGEVDPDAPLLWVPQVDQNGPRRLAATLFDRDLRPYQVPPVEITVSAAPTVVQDRLQDGQEITGRATIRLRSNFPIERIEVREGNTVIHQAGRSQGITIRGTTEEQYATFTWTPKPEQNGTRTVRAVAFDRAGRAYETAPVTVTVNVRPTVWLNVSPNQLVSGPLDLRVTGNVPLTAVDFHLIDPLSGRSERIAGGSNATAAFPWTPPANMHAVRRIQAAARDQTGNLLYSAIVDVRIVTVSVHGPTVLVPRERFRSLVEPMAVATYREMAMSASLQVAQAILETGWGQFVPTDKYTGQVSNNLFGIKGTGSAGSVVSNTWEVFGGVTYRIEDRFRAYRNVEESWKDHKEILMVRPWYEPFRAVMHDPVRGAWGLLRSGYATDPQYAIKLIRGQREQNLWQLDWVQP